MANCSSCSAPLPPNGILCEYCGNRNDVDLAGIHYHTTHELESPRSCPRCELRLTTIDLGLNGGTFLIERCDRCLGLFFDPGELEALLEGSVKNVFEINQGQINNLNKARRSAEYEVCYIKCPECSQRMNRVNFGTRSGVIVDRCREHGVWLDGGELRHLMEWMKAGGKLLDQQHREEREKEAAARERKQRSQQDHTYTTGSDLESSDFPFGTPFPTREPDLLGAVSNVIGFLLR